MVSLTLLQDFRSENGLYQLIQAQYEAAARQATQSQLPAPALKPADSNSRDDASNVDEFPSHRPSKRRKLSTATKEEIGAPGTSETSEANSSAESGGIGRHRADRKTRSRLELPNATDREKLGSLLIKQEPSELPNTSSTAPAPTCDDSFNTSSQDDQRTRVDNDDQARQNPELPQDNGSAPHSPSMQLSQEASDQYQRKRATSLPPGLCQESPSRLRAQPKLPQSSPPRHSSQDFPFERTTQPNYLDARKGQSYPNDFRERWMNWTAISNQDPPSSPPLRTSSPLPYPAGPTGLDRRLSAIQTPLNARHMRVLASLPPGSTNLSDPPLFCSSSPLSSPPPVLFDPCEGLSASSSRDTSFSSSTPPSEVDETPPSSNSFTPPPSQSSNSSQSSTVSTKLPIPNIKGRDLFDASIWSCPIRTSVFYTFATTLRQKSRDVSPTTSHLFIGHLRDRGKLVRCYTQNIDRIEEKVGLSTALERGPGQKSRFSTRRLPLSRANSSGAGKIVPAIARDGQSPPGQESEGSQRRTREYLDPF